MRAMRRKRRTACREDGSRCSRRRLSLWMLSRRVCEADEECNSRVGARGGGGESNVSCAVEAVWLVMVLCQRSKWARRWADGRPGLYCSLSGGAWPGLDGWTASGETVGHLIALERLSQGWGCSQFWDMDAAKSLPLAQLAHWRTAEVPGLRLDADGHPSRSQPVDESGREWPPSRCTLPLI